MVEMTKKRKFQFIGHHVCEGGTVRAGMEGGMEGRRGRGRPQGNWIGNLKEWSGKEGVELSIGKDRDGWKRTFHDWVNPWPSRLRSK